MRETNNDIETERRLSTLETQREADTRQMEAGFDLIRADIRDIKLTLKEEILGLRSDLNKNVRKTNDRFTSLQDEIALNTKFRERILIYISMMTVVVGVVLTYLKDIIHWLFNR